MSGWLGSLGSKLKEAQQQAQQFDYNKIQSQVGPVGKFDGQLARHPSALTGSLAPFAVRALLHC
jgi:hypothetical protein